MRLLISRRLFALAYPYTGSTPPHPKSSPSSPDAKTAPGYSLLQCRTIPYAKTSHRVNVVQHVPPRPHRGPPASNTSLPLCLPKHLYFSDPRILNSTNKTPPIKAWSMSPSYISSRPTQITSTPLRLLKVSRGYRCVWTRAFREEGRGDPNRRRELPPKPGRVQAHCLLGYWNLGRWLRRLTERVHPNSAA